MSEVEQTKARQENRGCLEISFEELAILGKNEAESGNLNWG